MIFASAYFCIFKSIISSIRFTKRYLAGYFYNSTQFGGMTCSEADTWGAGTVFVAKLATGESALVPVLSAVSQSGNGQIQFTVTGTLGSQYAVEVSTDLQQWNPVFTNSSPFLFADPVYPNLPLRFYRAALAQ